MSESSVTQAEVVVLGMGPGGETLVGELLSNNVSVIAIEAELVGGECPFWGCVPSKMMIRASTTLAEGRRVAPLAGASVITPDWAPVAKRIRDVATENWNDEAGVKRVVDNGGTFVRGRGVVTSDRTVEVNGTTYTATRALVISTGTTSAIPPVEGIEDVPFWTNRGAIETESVPDSLIVLGGGAIGCELAQMFHRFGAKVTIVEFAPRLLALEEPEASAEVEKAFRSEGITVLTGVAAKTASGQGPVTLGLSDGSSISADVLLVATGRKVLLAEIGADALGAGPQNGHTRFLPTDDLMRVLGANGEPIAGVYGIGDVAGKGAFTHVAVAHARMVADQLLGRETVPFSQRAVGHATFTDPEVGSVGLTEEAARKQGLDLVVATYPIAKTTRGWIHGEGDEGVLKIVVDRQSRTLVGATACGPHGGEVLAGFTTAIAGKVPIDVLRTTVWAYPTYHRGFDAVFDELPEDFKTVR